MPARDGHAGRRRLHLELYLCARDGASAPRRAVMAAGLSALTLAMGVGIAGAFMEMWLPRLQ